LEKMNTAQATANTRKAAVFGLIKSAKEAVKEFLAAEKAVEKQKEHEAKGQGPSQKKRGRPAKSLLGVTEHAAGIFEALPNKSDPDAAIPFLLSDSCVGKTLTKANHTVFVENQERFAPAFSKSDLRTKVGRACRPLYDEALWDRCVDMVGQPLPGQVLPLPSVDQKALRDACVPNHTGLVKNAASAGPDFENLPSFRISFAGTRFVVSVVHETLVKYATTGPDAMSATAVTGEWMKNHLSEITKEQAAALATAGKVYFGTVGPSDVLYTPAGFWVWEKARVTKQSV